jgi:O-antigen/teichoic acid export membrane protein
MLASLALAASYLALGLNSIAISRIVGAEGTGLVALSNQMVLIAVFVAGIGLRTSVAALVGSGRWSVRGAARGAITAAVGLGLLGAAAGIALYFPLRDNALDGFTLPMIAALMAALPAALLWWIVPALALARERYEIYALLTIAAPAGVLLLSPLLAALDGKAGAVYGLGGGYLIGGLLCAGWALRFAARPEAAEGPNRSLRDAFSLGSRSWVNDMFQVVNLRPDLFILNAYVSTAATGVYAVALSITSAGFILSQSLATVVLPRSAALEVADPERTPLIGERAAASAVRHGVLVSLVATAGLGLFLFAVPLIWGDAFEDTIRYGLIMLPGVALLGVGRIMVASFTGRGHPHYALAVGMLSFPATLIAYLLVIPDGGTTGAAIVTSVSYVLAAGLAALLFFRTVGVGKREVLIPTRSDVRDYERFAARLRSAMGR